MARELAALGVIRLYVGVENGSEAGGEHLQRGTQQAHVREALKACREAGIFVCYNLLVFEPEATLADVRENARFIREHADHPVNFCRAEPYFGTSLHVDLAKTQDLGGSYLGFNYRIADPRAELLFRICAAAFRERNFAPSGVANRYMGLGYAANVLMRFYNENGGAEVFVRRARELTRKISLDTAEWLEKAIELAERAPLEDWDTVERGTLCSAWRSPPPIDAFTRSSTRSTRTCAPSRWIRARRRPFRRNRTSASKSSRRAWRSACPCR